MYPKIREIGLLFKIPLYVCLKRLNFRLGSYRLAGLDAWKQARGQCYQTDPCREFRLYFVFARFIYTRSLRYSSRIYTLLLYSIYAQAARLPIYVQPLQKWSTLKGPYRIKGKNSFNALLLIAKKLAVLLLKLISLTGTLGRILFHYLAISLSHEYIVSNWFLVVVAFHAYIQSPAYYLYI